MIPNPGTGPDTWPPDVTKQAEKALLLLADLRWRTADEIADLFRVQGIRGRRGSLAFCPIATYLRRNGVEAPEVGGQSVYVSPPLPGVFPRPAVALPRSVEQFVDHFDSAEYLDLIDPDA